MDIDSKIDALSQKIDAIYVSVEKTRTYIQWALIATVIAFVLPLLGALILVPAFLSQYTATLNTLIQ
jgi:hypothetical protein